MDSRREFLEASAAALTVAATRPLFGAGVQSANDRVRMAIIGTGNRGGRVFDSFCRQKDCQFTAAAEVNKARLDSWMTPARQTFKLDVVGDYTKILDRKDIDAVLIATPDHWHSQGRASTDGLSRTPYLTMTSELRVALLGQGFMGKAHSNAFCQAGHFYDLPVHAPAHAAVRPRRGLARADGRALGLGRDLHRLARRHRPPRHRHRRHRPAESSARAGRDRRGRSRQDRLLRKAAGDDRRGGAADGRGARAAVPTLVWFNYRRVPAIAYARQLIDEGRLGQVFHYNAAYKQQWGADTSRAATWRMDPAQAGSGVADDLMTHLLDTALYLNGPITEVIADAADDRARTARSTMR